MTEKPKCRYTAKEGRKETKKRLEERKEGRKEEKRGTNKLTKEGRKEDRKELMTGLKKKRIATSQVSFTHTYCKRIADQLPGFVPTVPGILRKLYEVIIMIIIGSSCKAFHVIEYLMTSTSSNGSFPENT